jgi:pyrroloquinoline quinone biosynthesis protein B
MRTQSSIIVGNGSPDWALINASPDVLTQIKQTPALQPARQMRDSGIAAVVLMDAQVDHVTGLMMHLTQTSLRLINDCRRQRKRVAHHRLSHRALRR